MQQMNTNKSIITHRECLANNVYKVTLTSDECKFSRPGQFAMIDVASAARPYPVCDYDSRRFSIVFRSDNEDSLKLAGASIGTEVGTITGLGNGFDVDIIPDGAYLAADGTGVAEMLELARTLLIKGRSFKVVLGYQTRDSIFMMESFRSICNEIEVLTADGSNGREGTPADVIRDADYVCASGSLQMLKKLVLRCRDGQFSMSSQMLQTSEPEGDLIVPTRSGDTRSIYDGPVYDKNDIIWEAFEI